MSKTSVSRWPILPTLHVSPFTAAQTPASCFSPLKDPVKTSVSLICFFLSDYRLHPTLDFERPSCLVSGSVPCSWYESRLILEA